MIFAWDDLKALHDQRMSLARDELVRRLEAYQDASEVRVVLVFDGKQDAAEVAPQAGSIQVMYSKQHGTADAVIERLACKYAPDHDLTVASRDRAVLDMVASFGAHSISANGLLDLLETSERRFRDESKKHFR